MKERLRKILFINLIFLLLISLCACGETDYTIYFHEPMIIDLNSNTSTCELISKIGNKKISKNMIKKNIIQIDNFKVTCGQLNTKKIGSFTVKYLTNDAEIREIQKQVIVKDISAPMIKLEKNKIELFSDEVKNFSILADKLITIKDKTDKNPSLKISGDILSETPGIYRIKITAIDKSKNKSSVVLKVEVQKREEKKPIKIDEGNENQSSNEGDVIKTPNLTPPNNNQTPSETPPITNPITKDFLFSSGYDINTVYNACSSELLSSGRAGTCQPIRSSEGLLIGMRLIIQ